MLQDKQSTFRIPHADMLRAVLNEVLNGFALENREVTIGMKDLELRQLLTHLEELDNDDSIELNLNQIKAFRNALRETLRELGEEEFHTRTGFTFEEGEDVIKDLDGFISGR
jgi:hypothetical protein